MKRVKSKWEKKSTPPCSDAKRATENRAWKCQARPLPEKQESKTLGQTRQLQAESMLQKESLVKKQEGEKQVYL